MIGVEKMPNSTMKRNNLEHLLSIPGALKVKRSEDVHLPSDLT